MTYAHTCVKIYLNLSLVAVILRLCFYFSGVINMIAKIREYSIPLIAGVLLAVLWANLDYSSYHHFIHYKFIPGLDFLDFHFLVNDVFMYLFFATAGIEIVHSISPGGSLNPIKKAVTPLIATLGGVLGPIGIFFLLNSLIGSPEYMSGWGIGTATDIALAWLLARLVFGAHHPAVNFLLLLAVADDAIGLLIIAIFYPDPNHLPQYLWLLLVVVGMGVAFIMKKFGIKQWWLYLFVAGGIAWFGMYKCGMHPSLASVLVVFFIPNTKEMESKLGTISGEQGNDESIRSNSENRTCLENCEHRISPFVDYGLILFGISNAGVQLSEISNLTLIIFLSLIIGKTMGITLFTKFSVSVLKFELPKGMQGKDVFIAGFIAGMGLTVALFIAGSAFVDESLQAAAKMGALFSAFVFLIAPIWGKLIEIEKVVHPLKKKF